MTNGAPWSRPHVVPALPGDASLIYDWFNAAKCIAACAAVRFGAGSRAAAPGIMCPELLGRAEKGLPSTRPNLHAGRTKRRWDNASAGPAVYIQPVDVKCSSNPHGASEHLARHRIDDPAGVDDEDSAAVLLHFAANITAPIGYSAYQAAGIPIGSGPPSLPIEPRARCDAGFPAAAGSPTPPPRRNRRRLVVLVER